MESTINQRIKILREHLGFSQKEFAKHLDMQPGSLADVERGKVGVSTKLRKKLIELKGYKLNLDWLDTGAGEIGKLNVDYFNNHREQLAEELQLNKVAEPDQKYYVGIPMYDSAATAGVVEVYNDLVQNQPAFTVSIPQFRDCDFGKMIYGQSMAPTIESGTYVFCKVVNDKHFFLPGEIYYIEIDNFSICKRLQRSDQEGFALAISDNVEVRADGSRRYEDIDINLDNVRHMYIVKGYFKQTQN